MTTAEPAVGAGVPAVEAHGLTVRLDGLPILTDIDLTIRTGEVVALLGANGSGKSTLVRALLGLVPAEHGSVRLLGHPLSRDTPWQQIGYVPQRLPAGSGMPSTALEVVTSGLLHGYRLRPPRGARGRAMAALDRIGLADLAGQAVQHMSGGQQQRVLIARALVRQPRLLFLDEPTAGVDLPTQTVFVRTVADLQASGTTVLVILHELGEFAPLIERAVVLRHGRVVHDGPPPPPTAEHAGPGHDHLHHLPAAPDLPASGISTEVPL